MGLEKAHEGYEYQDLLTTFFILKEILGENESEFVIDKKEFQGDRIDDLQIKNKTGQQKIQIKYSGESDHTLQKSDIAGDAVYGIALDKLYENWRKHPEKELTKFRLCLAWNAPTDTLLNFLESISGAEPFSGFTTRSFKIKGEIIWPEGQSLPVTSWKRFRSKAKTIDRSSFLKFCNQLVIETTLPKFSLNLLAPGPLESLVLQQVKRLGIGVFPNQHIEPDHFILSLVAMIKRARSKGHSLNSNDIFYELKIRTDYGTIEQNFPVVQKENVKRNNVIEDIISQVEEHSKIILVGEPGSGKSWLIESLQGVLKQKGINSVRHYCYTRLDDLLQKERIQLNTFFGNLIHDILQAFPELKEVKEDKYASSLSELNLLLKNIQSPTFIIIDGLDHIERIFHFRSYSEISRQDIAIIETLEKLNTSPMVKIIVTSQNIPQLRDISSFYQVAVPGWSEDNVKTFMGKMKVRNRVIKKGVYLSKVLFDKSSGNPLYLKYLIDEVRKASGNLLELINTLPPYSFNLSEYYTYLVSQLNTREDVPQVLSGINFSVTRTELEEITGSGEYVLQSLEILSPVLKVNFSQSGYIIYHESFRRFIIDRLVEHSVSVDKKVFNPIIEWFESKDFFKYRKAFRYCLSFLFESGMFEKMLRYLNKTFVTQSVINGQPWELIERNFLYLVKAASYQKDLAKIVLLNEIDKVIATTHLNLENDFSLYFEALGRINGFAYVSEYLLFEGNPVLDAAQGLKACYVCDENNVVAPWQQYMELLRKGKSLETYEYRHYLRGLLVLKEGERINKMITQASKDENHIFLETAREELLTYKRKDYVKSLIKLYPSLKKVTKTVKRTPIPKEELFNLAKEILKFEHSFRNEAILLENFFNGFRIYADDKTLLNKLIEIFKSRNWFYNWIIYYLKIIAIKLQKKISYHQVKEAFDYLKYSTEPFMGKPRVCDLHSMHYLTYDSFREGLSLVKTETQWKEIIDLLTEVGNETTTTLQRSPSGPLETATLFKLFGEFLSDENHAYLNQVFENLTKEKEEYRLHADIAEYKLRLSCFYSLANDSSKATKYFNEGIEYMLAYTMRKDLTLEDVIEGVEWMALVDKPKAMEALKFSRVLIESAIDHTDGRETDYFPITWFERFLRIDFHTASIYLLDLLSKYRFYWIAERSLMDLLCTADGSVNPLIEYNLAASFPCNDSEKFVTYCLNLHDKLKNEFPYHAEKIMARIVSVTRSRHNRRFSNELSDRYNKLIKEYDGNFVIPIEHQSFRRDRKKWYEDSIIERPELSAMPPCELGSYFEANGIRANDLNALCYYFDQQFSLNKDLKELIEAIVRKNNRQYSDAIDIDIVFKTGNEIECYYWVCRFFFDQGGWFQRFINQEAFTSATTINHNKAMEFLFELMPSGLNIGFNITFSSNLIRVLINTGHNEEEIKSMWSGLVDMTSYRLPFKEEIEWDSVVTDEFNMSDEEILICMLLTRFKAATTERFRNVTIGVKDILDNSPEKFEKPLKWFIKHREKFLQPALSIVLQLILDHRQKDDSYHLKFKTEIKSIFPTHYFLIDLVISKLYDLDISDIHLPGGIIYPPMSGNEFDWFSRRNKRFKPMQVRGIDLHPVFQKYKAGFQRKYQELFGLYQNRVREQWASHIYSSDFFLELINIDLYNQLKHWQCEEDNDILEYSCFIDTSAIIAYGKCFTFRPADLIRPSEITAGYSRISTLPESDWIRLAHFERSLIDERDLRTRPITSYGAMHFSDTKEQVLPYSSYNISPFYLWTDQGYNFKYNEEIVFAVFQEDALEYYRLLWLNPSIVKSLGLVTKITDSGLIAITESGETVLRMRTWHTDYFGDGMHPELSDEIPKYEGADLIMRKDYFQKMSIIFKHKPSYVNLKIEGKYINEK